MSEHQPQTKSWKLSPKKMSGPFLTRPCRIETMLKPETNIAGKGENISMVPPQSLRDSIVKRGTGTRYGDLFKQS